MSYTRMNYVELRVHFQRNSWPHFFSPVQLGTISVLVALSRLVSFSAFNQQGECK